MRILKRLRLWKFQRRAKKIQAMAQRFDKIMQNMKLTRCGRRQMWREIIKSSDVRKETFESLAGKRP